MWSVVILSSTFKDTGASIVSSSGAVSGYGLMFGPLKISILSIVSSGSGSSIMLSFTVNFSGSTKLGISPSSVGSENTPLIAE